MYLNNFKTRSTSSIIQKSYDDLIALSKFELHYDIDGSDGAIDILKAILQDLSSHRPLHNWDELLVGDAVKDLARFANQEFSRLGLNKGTHTLDFSALSEVCTINGVNRRNYAPSSQVDIARQFRAARDLEAILAGSQDKVNLQTPRVSYGRTVYTKESMSNVQRATLLLIHAFCLRLQDEDFTFIHHFVHRHLSLKMGYKEPFHLQDTTPSDNLAKCFRRVTVSFHLPHILLGTSHDFGQGLETLDRKFLERFEPKQGSNTENDGACLYMASSSVLLSIVVPQEDQFHEEALDLLAMPEALWTVLVINGPINAIDGFQRDPVEFFTPIAQFVRGICGAIHSQRVHVSPILERLKKRLPERPSTSQASEVEYLFDDQSFTKSILYHWIVKTCYDLDSSIERTLKFVHRFEKNSLTGLQRRAHPYEQNGLAHWVSRFREETAELDAVRAEVHALKTQVVELREAMYGATAVLESRINVMQSERIRILTYLSTAYLPITTVASLYSMNVLPSKATLGSFIGVVILVLLLTMGFAFNLRSIFCMLRRSQQRASGLIFAFMKKSMSDNWKNFTPASPSLPQQRLYEQGRWRTNGGSMLLFLLEFLLELPGRELQYVLALFQRPEVPFYVEVKFSVGKLIGDLLRVLFLPLWIALVLLYFCGHRLIELKKRLF